MQSLVHPESPSPSTPLPPPCCCLVVFIVVRSGLVSLFPQSLDRGAGVVPRRLMRRSPARSPAGNCQVGALIIYHWHAVFPAGTVLQRSVLARSWGHHCVSFSRSTSTWRESRPLNRFNNQLFTTSQSLLARRNV